MSSDVVLTAALRNNLLSLQNTQRLIDDTQLRLATGLRVNSALDGPTAFFTAQNLNNRAGDLSRLLDGISQSIRTIEEADIGVTALTRLVEQAQSVAFEAEAELQSAEGFARIRGSEDLTGVNLTADLAGITDGATDQFRIVFEGTVNGTAVSQADTVDIVANSTIEDVVGQINDSATVGVNNTTNGQLVEARVTSGGQLEIVSLVDGAAIRIEAAAANSVAAAGFADLGLDNVVRTETTNAPGTQQGGTVIAGNVITSAVTAGTKGGNGEFLASDTLVTAGYLNVNTASINIDLTIDGTTTTLSGGPFLGTDTVQDVVDGVNAANISDVEARFNVNTGRIELEFGDNIGQVEITFREAVAATTSFGFGTGEADVALGGNNASEIVTLAGTSATLDQFESDFNTLREQIDEIIEDAEFRGVNLLNSDDLTTFFNEDRTNLLETQGVDFSSLGLGIIEGDFTDANGVSNAISQTRAALDDVRNFGQSIANDLTIIQTRRDFTESTINTLRAGADDLTVADQNEEGANLLALQTRQQLGVTSLALAAQSQQAVLRLF